MKFTGRYKTDYLGHRYKIYLDKWGYERTKEIYPMNWIWPFKDIFHFKLYRDFIKLCTPEEIGNMRQLIGRYGFNRGVHIFEGWLRSKRTMEDYNVKAGLRDIADGLEPGQSQREYVSQVEAGWKKDEERNRKKQLLDEYRQELKDQQELDRVSEQDIIDAINKLKKKP